MDEELRQAIEAVKEQQPVELSLKWYQGTVQLDDIKQYIRANINSASRSFLAIGYYLKYIRDNELFSEDDYQNIWEFAQVEFGISKSSASRFMAINDRFSKDGNSPILLDRYKDFSSSKLSEMLTMTDEQLEQVTITTTRAEIREMKQPAKDEVVAPAQQESDQTSPLGYSKSVYPPDSLITSKGCGNKHNCYSCARICQMRQENRYCVEAPLGHPYSCTTMNVLDSIENDIGGECMFINLELAYHRAGDHEPSPCCKECKNKCGYACRKAAHEPKLDDIHETVNAKPENVDNEPEILNDVDEADECSGCSLNGNIDVGILECHPENDEHKCWIEDEPDPVEILEADIVQTEPKHKQQVLSITNADAIRQMTDKQLAGIIMCPYGEDGISCKDNIRGLSCIDCSLEWLKVNKADDGLLEEIEAIENEFIRTEQSALPLKRIPDKWYYLVPIGANDITGKAIREGDILEWTDRGGNTKLHQVYYEPRSFSFKPCEIDRVGTDTLIMIPDHELCKSRIIRNVHEGEEFVLDEFEQEQKKEQPELPILRNNDQRKEFIEAFETWPVWIDTKETEERYYRYDFDNGSYIVVKVYFEKGYSWGTLKNKDHWGSNEYYLVKSPGSHFKDCQTNMTALIEYLKEIQKKGA